MKKLFSVLAALVMVPALYAAEDTVIRNLCDSLSLGAQPMIEIVPAYIEESNWYGNPKTWAKDSSNFTRHESYKTVNVVTNAFRDSIPLSIQATCRETQGTTFKYATWNNSKQWIEREKDDIATNIFDIHNLKMDGHDSSNTFNVLAFVPEKIPDNGSFAAGHLLFSKTFELAFEWWYVGARYQNTFDTLIDGKTVQATRNYYSSSVGSDSLRAFNSAIKALKLPDTTKYVGIQVLRVVLADSRKPLDPESSSSVNPESSSSSGGINSCASGNSSSSETSSSSGKVSSSSEASSSSSADPVSCSSAESSSSSADPVSCSSAESSSSAAQSSSSKEPESSSSSGDINSCASGNSSSSESASSSSAEPESSSAAEPSSSSDVESSSSEEGPTHIAKVRVDSESVRFVQVRRLDGTVVNNSGKLAPGVYYVKDSRGLWKKMAVLPR